MTLEGALLLANVLFLTLGALTLAAAVVVLMLGRAVERAKDHQIATLRLEASNAATRAADQMAQVESRLLAWLDVNTPSRRADSAPRLPAPPALGQVPPSPAAIAAPSPIDPGANRLPTESSPLVSAFEALPLPSQGVPDQSLGTVERHLSAAQKQRMEAILRLAPSLIMITTDGRPEPERFADELQAVFEAAGWHVERAVYASLNRPLAPLSANLKTTPIDIAVSGAFAASGLPLSARDAPQANADREIFVGAAPRP